VTTNLQMRTRTRTRTRTNRLSDLDRLLAILLLAILLLAILLLLLLLLAPGRVRVWHLGRFDDTTQRKWVAHCIFRPP